MGRRTSEQIPEPERIWIGRYVDPMALGALSEQGEEEPEQWWKVALYTGDHDPLDISVGPDGADQVHARTERNEDASPGVTQLMAELAGGIDRIAGNHDCADPKDGIVGNHKLGTIREEKGNPIARLNTKGLQASPKPVHRSSKPPVVQLGTFENERRPMRILD
jgi:hypothetical protein